MADPGAGTPAARSWVTKCSRGALSTLRSVHRLVRTARAASAISAKNASHACRETMTTHSHTPAWLYRRHVAWLRLPSAPVSTKEYLPATSVGAKEAARGTRMPKGLVFVGVALRQEVHIREGEKRNVGVERLPRHGRLERHRGRGDRLELRLDDGKMLKENSPSRLCVHGLRSLQMVIDIVAAEHHQCGLCNSEIN